MSKETLLADSAASSNARLASDLGDIHAENLETSLARFDYRVPRHRHTDLFQFFVIERGQADCQLAKQYVKLSGPGVLVVPADTVHQMAFSADSAGYTVSISLTLMHAFERLSRGGDWLDALYRAAWIPLDVHHEVVGSGRTLWSMYTDASDHRLQLTANALSFVCSVVAVCRDATTVSNLAVSQSQQRLVDLFLEDIEKHYASRDTVADYCERLHVTERTLRRATTACLQSSPIALIHKRKCLEAQRLLRFTSLSISGIAHALGFSDPSYFSRRFKQLTGMVPRDIRP